MKKHIENVHEKKFKCDICYRRFSTNDGLQSHMSDKNVHKKIICKICDKQVNSGGHVKKFHSNGDVKCPKCDKTFPVYYAGLFAFA